MKNWERVIWIVVLLGVIIYSLATNISANDRISALEEYDEFLWNVIYEKYWLNRNDFEEQDRVLDRIIRWVCENNGLAYPYYGLEN